MKNNECIDAALAALEEAGIRDVVVVPGGRHPQLRWRVNGHALRVFAVPGSPSDWRSPRNVRADVRRILREDGVITEPEPEPARPPVKVDRIGDLERRVAAIEQHFKTSAAAACNHKVET